jgi:hypothetical protein
MAIMQSNQVTQPAQEDRVGDVLKWCDLHRSQDKHAIRQSRIESARQLRMSYEEQIKQREKVHAAYAKTEDTWPYQPVHHPESRFPYFKGPKYIAPHHLGDPSQL